jgi:hypothetical protein
MDLNQLYFEHQMLLMQSSAAGCDELRMRIGYDASRVAGSIERLNRESGAPKLRHWKGSGSSRAANTELNSQAA